MGISWADDAIHLVDAAAGGTLACGGLALGAVAARDLSPGDELCTIPKPACITLRTSSIADVLDAEQLGGGLGLTLAVLHEAALGEASKWYGYFQAMPGREYLPIFWGEEEMARLKGTDIEGAAAADRCVVDFACCLGTAFHQQNAMRR